MSRNALTSVYISDLDGTLLRGDATLSDYSYTVLCRLIDAGLKFTVASARSVVSMRPMLRGLELPLPVIEFNGAFVTDLGSDRKLVVNDFQKAVLEMTYEIIMSFRGPTLCIHIQRQIGPGLLREIRERGNELVCARQTGRRRPSVHRGRTGQ